MKIRIHFYALFLVLISCTLVFSKNQKPKIALVLSGGGAKGIAHIPVLQALDSLGIVPDLVIGASMGSLVGVDYAMGTNMFDQISIKAFNENDKLQMQFEGHERTPAVLKGALHYDMEQGVGLLVNVTGRNILEKASRSLITFDIAEEPKFRVQHQKYFGKIKDWWWRSEAFGQRLKQKIYINGKKADNFVYRYFQYENQINRGLNFLSSYIGMKINDAFSPSGKWSEEVETSGVISAGASASYKSFLGLIDFDISWVNDINKIRIFIGFGYQFNRSN